MNKQDFMKLPMDSEEIGHISVRLSNILSYKEIDTVEEFLAVEPDEWKKTRNLGAKTMEEIQGLSSMIKAKLKELGEH